MKKGAKLNTAFKGFGRLSPNSKQRKWRGEKGVGTTRIQSGLQTNTRSQPQQLKQRQRRAALRGRLSRSPRWRTVLGVAGSASAHLISHRWFQASTGGGAPDSPTGAAVKQPAASALAIGAGFAQQQQQLSTRAGFKQQHLISTRAGFTQPSTGLPACFYCGGGSSFFPLPPGKKISVSADWPAGQKNIRGKIYTGRASM